ncbi:hypothetical protein LCGC14_1287530 [marine sediment metagenome]|uniref:Uncharacterized protein n=1 Tax=marine sediment metagenome TaxID=412755 RepID=A0A0F9KV45_9ZZZZ
MTKKKKEVLRSLAVLLITPIGVYLGFSLMIAESIWYSLPLAFMIFMLFANTVSIWYKMFPKVNEKENK